GPACILDRRAGGKVPLRWTAVGDDGRCGTATAYELRLRAHHTHELRERHADRDLTARARWDPGVTDVPAAGRRRLLRAPRGGQDWQRWASGDHPGDESTVRLRVSVGKLPHAPPAAPAERLVA